MVQDRLVAEVVSLGLLHSGEYVEGQGEFGANCVLVGDVRVVRVNVVGVVVEVFDQEEQVFSSIAVDDGSGVVDVRGFSENRRLVQGWKVGDAVRVVGRVKQYQDVLYLVPEVVRRVEDVNEELLHKVVVASRWKGRVGGGSGRVVSDAMVTAAAEERDRMRRRVLALVQESSEGVSVESVAAQLGVGEEVAVEVLDGLLRENVVYLPRPRLFKAI